MLGFGLVSVYLQANAGQRSDVLAVARPVPAGTQLQPEDLNVVRISEDSSLRPVPASQQGNVVGQTAAVTLMPGTLLTQGQLHKDPGLAAGKVVIGLSLKPGQAPTTLQQGAQVMVLATGSAASLVATSPGAASIGGQDPRGTVLVRQATVVAVSEERSSDNLTASLLVNENAAPVIAGAAAVGQVTIASHPGP